MITGIPASTARKTLPRNIKTEIDITEIKFGKSPSGKHNEEGQFSPGCCLNRQLRHNTFKLFGAQVCKVGCCIQCDARRAS